MCQVPDTSPNATGWAQASDDCDQNPTITYSDQEEVNGEVHTIIRTWIATDACGNSSQAQQRITYRLDQTPPTLTVPQDVDLGCNPQDTSPDTTGWAQASDNCDPNPQITYSDEVSVQGCRVTITRTWVAKDACGNSSQGQQTITYTQDTTPPTVQCDDISVTIHDCSPDPEVWVDFDNVTAEDNCDPNPSLTYSPSGDWFSVGTHMVTISYTTRDACGNTESGTCTFWVTVENENEAPVASNKTVETSTGYICLPVPAYDPDGDPLTVEIVSDPACGSAWVDGDSICFSTGGETPCSYGMRVHIGYKVTDPCGESDYGTITVHVTCNPCPTSVSPGPTP